MNNYTLRLVKNAIAFCFMGFLHSGFAASPEYVTVASSMQSELGCTGDWQPSCGITHMVKTGNEWSVTLTIPAGSWEYKIALNDSWTESYGYNLSSDNAKFSLTEAKAVTFTYDEITHMVTDTSQGDPVADPQPTAVTIAGNLQSELSCTGDWLPDCAATHLLLDSADNVWQKSFLLPAGEWQYKATLDNSWAENYGANAKPAGDNIAFTLAAPKNVKFYYSHKTHWVTSSENSVIATVVGNFQKILGCSSDWAPDCLYTWLQDVNRSGLYSFSTTALPIGTYEAKVALNENWNESYGNDTGDNIQFNVTQEKQKIFFTYDSANHKVYVGDEVVTGDLKSAKAHWLTRDTVAMNLTNDIAASSVVTLHYSPDGSLVTGPAGVTGGSQLTLSYDANGLTDALKTAYPHLKNLSIFKLASSDIAKVPDILKQQIAISAQTSTGKLIDATGVQFAGVIDDIFAYNGDLGVIYSETAPNVPLLKLWAPTAKSVKVHIYEDGTTSTETTVVNMALDPATGVWSVAGDASWNRKYYLYEVEVFVRNTGKVEKNWVTDPYSFAVSTNGKRSMFVNLNDADLKPESWDSLTKPILNAPEDIVLYELHVRDFSIVDATVPEAERGTFMAFTENAANGMKHLKGLADAGLTHVHLLPAFDCATVNEIKSEQKKLTEDLSLYAPDSESQQAAVAAIRGADGFNWCYDPLHYTVPDGSYATDPEGITRIKEFRAMVAALNQSGLRVVMDVVFNHTSGALLSNTSVLDKIVPTYYYRLNAIGDIETSTCCANTASENAMMEKLMLDSIKTWATQYKVDGFRYDIMGHHTKNNIVKIKNEIQSLTPESNGVDGSKIYFYGEGWNFGEVKDNARFTQATIGNMSGTGVGTFNDRFRDTVRGGGCCDSGLQLVQNQGFVTGLFTAPNAENLASDAAKNELLKAGDKLKIVLTGSLTDFRVIDRNGTATLASDLDATGYTQDPSETINYIEAHDNETFFDIIQYKAPLTTSMDDRVRMQNLGTSIVLLAQGIPFLHAGQEILRSKSFDRNSYDSGDWFNLLDFTYQQNGWGRGLPIFQDNQNSWSLMKSRLANVALAPTSAHIARTHEATLEMLKIRKGSPLFRLTTAEQIKNRLYFYNSGADSIPGLVVMDIKDSALSSAEDIDPAVEEILVMFNANPETKSITISELKDRGFALHPVQQASTDSIIKQASVNAVTGEFSVPARSTAVFIVAKNPLATPIPTATPTPAATPMPTASPSPVNPPGNSGGGAFDIFGLWLSFALLVLIQCKRFTVVR